MHYLCTMEKRNFLSSIPPVTRHLLCVNIIVWLISSALYRFGGFDVVNYLGLHYCEASRFNLVQFVTYMFLHDTSGFFHIFFNMLTLYCFGPILEYLLGRKRFLTYYLVCGIGAALIQQAVWAWGDGLHDIFVRYIDTDFPYARAVEHLNQYVTVGASGAIFGLLLAFAMLLPNAKIILFVFPIPAKYAVPLLGLLELVFGVSGTLSSVAHFAHLGGVLFGLILILYWRQKGIINRGGYY